MKRNRMEMEFTSCSENEAFARIAVAAFVAQLDPTLEELTDIKTVVSEAVTNAVIHAYGECSEGMMVRVSVEIEDTQVAITVTDRGVGIVDVEQARQPLYTSRPEWERAGMGFSIMEHFMDQVRVRSTPGQGTVVHMIKKLQASRNVAVVN
ncbi:anti-sigma F factor [Pasteuria penetrans]|uniref:Anti-sigma F factor n=2 Tax=Pasteuria penetrans TaxID=86005 RepID=SP2AB_PASPE|nr:anti-sigma F factor [Pasteuria penetrans]P59624.1 RecName: Full=Anti-sigma F factor; AltName: Full=Stage II sporulation protein AB [Pasteuria penetrans]AAO63809.1 SpoIIAB [Pasteuria penetrans]